VTSISKPLGKDPKNPLRQLIGRFVTHSAQHVIVAPVGPGADLGPLDDNGTECSVVQSRAQLDVLAADFAGFQMDNLRTWIDEGGFIVAARRPPEGRVIGYRLCQRGVFRSSLGLKAPISPDFLLVHWAEVRPEYRGQRVAEALRRACHRVARQTGIRWTYGVVSLANEASLAAHLRPYSGTEPRVVATIHRFIVFKWLSLRTPWRRVARALERLRHRG
jgi:GNAT superfamily N-acetyltransferase